MAPRLLWCKEDWAGLRWACSPLASLWWNWNGGNDFFLSLTHPPPLGKLCAVLIQKILSPGQMEWKPGPIFSFPQPLRNLHWRKLPVLLFVPGGLTSLSQGVCFSPSPCFKETFRVKFKEVYSVSTSVMEPFPLSSHHALFWGFSQPLRARSEGGSGGHRDGGKSWRREGKLCCAWRSYSTGLH